MARQYLELLEHVLTHGKRKSNRTGVDTIAVFGYQNRYDLSEGFPLLTTKKMFTKGVFTELLWFLRGETNIAPLIAEDVHIWTPDAYRAQKGKPGFPFATFQEYISALKADPQVAREYGELGPVYGQQWRNFGGIDQIAAAIERITRDPDSRRHIITAWNPAELDRMALPPCHALYQFSVDDGRLSCQLYQRSADLFHGVPFNIASYAALTHMIAHVTGLEPGEFIHTFGDAHIYVNHLDAVHEQLAREPRPLPRLVIPRRVERIFDFTLDDLRIEGYDPHPRIEAPFNAGIKEGE